MKNDNNEKSKNKALFQRLAVNKPFQVWVRSVRNKAGIPDNGKDFSDDEGKNSFSYWVKNFDKDVVLILNEIDKFCQAHIEGKANPDFWKFAIFNYIISGDEAEFSGYDYGCYCVSRNTPLEAVEKLLKNAVPVFIFPYASQRDVIKFIEKNWSNIRFLNEYDHKKLKNKVHPKVTPRHDIKRATRIAGINLLALRTKTKSEEHQKIYSLFKEGKIKSDGTTNIKYAWDELGLTIRNTDNIRKIIQEQKKLHRQLEF